MRHKRCLILTLLLVTNNTRVSAQSLNQADARQYLDQVLNFYRSEVGFEGAYLWQYSADLKHQEGEGIATRTSGWTQPPGAPSVGEAYLRCWRLTDDQKFLDAAIEVARALVRSQLESGGWSSHFDLGPGGRRYAYRVAEGNAGPNNRTTFDDNKSQSALMLLMHVDEATSFLLADIHEAVEYALDHFLAAQYPNGAWPQQYSDPPVAADYPVLQASFPDDWPRTYPAIKYIGFYTLNDNNMSRLMEVLLEARRIYGRQDCFAAAKRTGDFFLLAQLPDPQPGWAQQYNRDMHPVWARKFEPPAVTGGESQAVMRSLLLLYQHTADQRYLAAVLRALDYYESLVLDDGRLARFYELQTNRPLYFTKEYRLTYDDSDVPTHYAFRVSSKLNSIRRQANELARADAEDLKPHHSQVTRAQLSTRLQRDAARVVNALDHRGAWVASGTMRHQQAKLAVIEMKTFAKNLEILARFAGATK